VLIREVRGFRGRVGGERFVLVSYFDFGEGVGGLREGRSFF